MEGLETSLAGLSADLALQATRPAYKLSNEAPLRRRKRLSDAVYVTDRYSIKTALVLSTLGAIGAPQNIYRLAPSATSSVCHPCLAFTPTGAGIGILKMHHTSLLWSATLEIGLPTVAVAETLYVETSLVDRVQRFTVYAGPVADGATKIEEKYYVHTGPYEDATAHYLYTATGTTVAKGFYDPSTLQLSHTLMNSARAAFYISEYSTLPLRNRVRNNFTVPTLLQDAGSVAAYASMYTSTVHIDAHGPRSSSGAACFDGEAALIHNVVDDGLVLDGVENMGHTACLWFNRTGAFDTLFPTLLDGAGSVRFFAFFTDVSYNPSGMFPTDIRASPPSLASTSIHTPWTHVCATSAINQPAKLYVNGTLVSSETEASVVGGQAAQRPLALGGSSDLSLHTGYGVDRGVHACVNEAIVWGRVLSPTEVARVHSSSFGQLSTL
jgi:hypothetical protein